MTEAEWLACDELKPMLHFLGGKASDRKLRLFAVACCRRIWDKITEECGRQAVEISERFADGAACLGELEAAFFAADRAHTTPGPGPTQARLRRLASWHALDAARLAAHPEMRGLADGTACAAAMAGAEHSEGFWNERAGEEAAQTFLLRDVVGPLPFRTFSIAAPCLAWNDGALRKMAQAIFDNRAFDRLPLLADALEDAGCTDADILGHCRGGGEHVRGCWVVDLLLGKE